MTNSLLQDVNREDVQLVVDDVSNDLDKCATAHDLVVESYRHFVAGDFDPVRLREELCFDFYWQQGRTRTYLVRNVAQTATLPENLGTCRVVLGQTADEPHQPLEMMSDFTVPGGWPDFNEQGFDPLRIAEGTRMALSSCFRSSTRYYQPIMLDVIKVMTDAMFADQEKYGWQQLWAVMPRNLSSIYSKVGFHMIEISQAQLDWKRNQQQFDYYAKYWIKRSPKLFCILQTERH